MYLLSSFIWAFHSQSCVSCLCNTVGTQKSYSSESGPTSRDLPHWTLQDNNWYSPWCQTTGLFLWKPWSVVQEGSRALESPLQQRLTWKGTILLKLFQLSLKAVWLHLLLYWLCHLTFSSLRIMEYNWWWILHHRSVCILLYYKFFNKLKYLSFMHFIIRPCAKEILI